MTVAQGSGEQGGRKYDLGTGQREERGEESVRVREESQECEGCDAAPIASDIDSEWGSSYMEDTVHHETLLT